MPTTSQATSPQFYTGHTENSGQPEEVGSVKPMSSSHHASSFQTDGYIDWPEQQFCIPVEHEDFHRGTMHPESFGYSLLPSHPAPSHFPNYDPNNVYQDGPENCPRWLPSNNPLLNNSNYAASTIAAAQTTEPSTTSFGGSYSGQIEDVWGNGSGSQGYLGSPPGHIQTQVETSTHSPREPLENASPRPADGEEVPQHVPEPGNGHRRMPASTPFVTFTCRGQVGISLSSALAGPPQDLELDHAEDDTLLRDFKSKVYYFIFWPGYKPFMQSKNNHRKRNFVTRAEIVHHVARVVYSFFSGNERYAVEEGHEKWRIGVNGIKLENIRLIGLKKYGAAGITPVFAYQSVPAPRSWEY